MKIRYGFVTNSSSSSFIVSFQSKDTILKELGKANLSAENLGLLVQSLNAGTEMTWDQVKDYVSTEITGDVEYERWKENQKDSVDQEWDAPLTGKWLEELNKRVDAIMQTIPKDAHNIQLEEGDDSLPGSILEHEILPYLPITKASFSHH